MGRAFGLIVLGLLIVLWWVSVDDKNTTRSTPSTGSSSRLAPLPDLPLLVVTNWACRHDYSYMILEGQVENVSGKKLESVVAVASYYTASGDFVTSDTALIEYNPLLPGQRSPFKTITRGNPAIKRCNIDFKYFWGGAIKFEDTKTHKAREREEAKAREREEIAKENPGLVQAQKHLLMLGYDIGPADGVMGSKTRAALLQFADKEGLQFEGDVSDELLELLQTREDEHLGKR